jgi:hypothetical protein
VGGAIIIAAVFSHTVIDAKEKQQAKFEVIQH